MTTALQKPVDDKELDQVHGGLLTGALKAAAGYITRSAIKRGAKAALQAPAPTSPITPLATTNNEHWSIERINSAIDAISSTTIQ